MTAKVRKARSARHGLTRDRVVAAARDLLAENGLAALSMRALAQKLGVSTMALYNHVGGKEDLVRAIADATVRELHIPSSDDWRERLRLCFRALRKACLATPAAIPLIEAADALDPAIFQPMEITLQALREAGFDLDAAMKGYCLLIGFTMGHVSYEVRGPFRGLDAADAVRRRALSADKFPRVAEAASLPAWDFDAAFEYGLDTIIAGLDRSALPGE